MKRIWMSFMFLIGGMSLAQQECPLLYNGIYYFEIDDERTSYVRFYQHDQFVVHTTSLPDVMNAMTYINRENASKILSGNYTYGKCNVMFKPKGISGKMKFSGSIDDDRLVLKVTNVESGLSETQVYHFMADPDAPLPEDSPFQRISADETEDTAPEEESQEEVVSEEEPTPTETPAESEPVIEESPVDETPTETNEPVVEETTAPDSIDEETPLTEITDENTPKKKKRLKLKKK